MPNIASAKKRVRQSEKRRARNRAHKERLRKALRAFRDTLEQGDPAAVEEGLKTVYKAVDQAGVKGILHKNATARKKSRLALEARRRLGATS
jgi:small subunit ribosomal protein S20